MKVDTSDYTIGGILSIECENGKWRPVAYLSKLLNETEREIMKYMIKRYWQLFGD